MTLQILAMLRLPKLKSKNDKTDCQRYVCSKHFSKIYFSCTQQCENAILFYFYTHFILNIWHLLELLHSHSSCTQRQKDINCVCKWPVVKPFCFSTNENLLYIFKVLWVQWSKFNVRDSRCTRGMILNKNHLITPYCPRLSIALQLPIVA